MSKIGQYIVDNDIDTDYYSDHSGYEVYYNYPESYLEWTEGEKFWEAITEWKEIFENDQILF